MTERVFLTEDSQMSIFKDEGEVNALRAHIRIRGHCRKLANN